ncbi:MAG: glycoside hydrolase family 15 protein, partial [Thiovulaceae bacterium]|nr:glycoside hydrolase family 15 protein [Sulfurimonadaceae bacterium]
LEDSLLDIVIRQKRLAVGRAYSEEATLSKPLETAAIIKTIVEFCGSSAAEGVLTQEVTLHLGHLIRLEPELFTNMLTIRTWYFVQLLVGHISRENALSMGDGYELLLGLAPHDIYDRLRSILTSFSREVTQLVDQESLHASGVTSLDSVKAALGLLSPQDIFARLRSILNSFTREVPQFDGQQSLDASGASTSMQAAPPTELSQVHDWAYWRQHVGMIGGLSSLFYKDIWYLLQQCNALVIGDKYNVQNRIGSEFTFDSTAGEQSFALRIDALLQSIDAADYRQLNIEAIESLSRVFRQSPQLHVDNDLILDVLIGHAVRIAWENHHGSGNYDEQRGQAWAAFYTLPPQEADGAFIEAFRYLLAAEGLHYERTI